MIIRSREQHASTKTRTGWQFIRRINPATSRNPSGPFALSSRFLDHRRETKVTQRVRNAHTCELSLLFVYPALHVPPIPLAPDVRRKLSALSHRALAFARLSSPTHACSVIRQCRLANRRVARYDFKDEIPRAFP